VAHTMILSMRCESVRVHRFLHLFRILEQERGQHRPHELDRSQEQWTLAIEQVGEGGIFGPDVTVVPLAPTPTLRWGRWEAMKGPRSVYLYLVPTLYPHLCLHFFHASPLGVGLSIPSKVSQPLISTEASYLRLCFKFGNACLVVGL
jgi:hypothetical protein